VLPPHRTDQVGGPAPQRLQRRQRRQQPRHRADQPVDLKLAKSTARAETDGGYADLLYSPLTAGSDHAIIDAVGAIAAERGVTQAQIALAWLHRQPVVTAPLVGANSTAQIDDAVASLGIELTAGELTALQRPYTPRHDFQGISDEAEIQKIRDQIPGYASF
jgi:1-deoxyxylulose-5-phosphate synthase